METGRLLLFCSAMSQFLYFSAIFSSGTNKIYKPLRNTGCIRVTLSQIFLKITHGIRSRLSKKKALRMLTFDIKRQTRN